MIVTLWGGGGGGGGSVVDLSQQDLWVQVSVALTMCLGLVGSVLVSIMISNKY